MAMHPPDPDPEVDSALDGALGNGLSHGLHRWRVYTRRGDEAPSGESRGHYVRAPIFQQSVTLTAKMWPEEGDGAGGSAGGWSAWRVSGEHLPLVVGGVAGGALIVMLVVAAVVWRLCVLRRDKQYRVRMGECAPEPRPVQPVMPSESAVFASPVSGRWAYQSRLLGSPHGGSGGSGGDCSPRGTSTPPAGLRSPVPGTPPPQAWVYGDTIVADPLQRDALQAMHRAASASASASASPSPAVHRSISLQLAQQSPVSQGGRRGYPHGAVHGGAHGAGYGPSRHPGRPLSVVSSMGSYSAGCSPATPRHSAVLPPPPPEFLLPDICEFNPGAGAASVGPGAAASAQYASSSGKSRIHLHEP
ncbi:uncharacterized protein LOC117641727 isoform X2 [Thrips palmi]|uniref:Uncharacterized protein LOC117641727 isoform X2 n=1 Tax=Thrips palmi TaxID=161013 RepID=A0A6P8ZJE1_THRPL|nr:uncharacterized protein LOC117641727 isoform X2 [Thrips palmi]